MKKTKKLNIVSLIIILILIGLIIYFIKPTKLITYARAKFGVKNEILVYEVSKSDPKYKESKEKLGSFLKNRGISGTAYTNGNKEIYVTIVPKSTNPKTEKNFGFKQVTPEEFYKNVYNLNQVYFTRTMRLIEN